MKRRGACHEKGSTFHSDAALLPEEGYGIVLLYNQSYALADYEGTRRGLIDLLVGKRPDYGGPGASKIGTILAALVIVTTALQVAGLLRLRGWRARIADRSLWLLMPGIAWKFVPVGLLFGLQPPVASFAGRVFSYPQLFWAMPDVVGWMVLAAVLGTVSGTARVLCIARRGAPRRRSGPNGAGWGWPS